MFSFLMWRINRLLKQEFKVSWKLILKGKVGSRLQPLICMPIFNVVHEDCIFIYTMLSHWRS